MYRCIICMYLILRIYILGTTCVLRLWEAISQPHQYTTCFHSKAYQTRDKLLVPLIRYEIVSQRLPLSQGAVASERVKKVVFRSYF
jgi:hypothetical protein